jgi:hypothetical protein
MCIQCHQLLSDETILRQLTEELATPNFEVWNGTSISHLVLAVTGVNGTETQDLAINLIDQYQQWAQTNTNSQRAQYATEVSAYSKKIRDKVLEQGLTQDQIKTDIFHNHDNNIFSDLVQPVCPTEPVLPSPRRWYLDWDLVGLLGVSVGLVVWYFFKSTIYNA